MLLLALLLVGEDIADAVRSKEVLGKRLAAKTTEDFSLRIYSRRRGVLSPFASGWRLRLGLASGEDLRRVLLPDSTALRRANWATVSSLVPVPAVFRDRGRSSFRYLGDVKLVIAPFGEGASLPSGNRLSDLEMDISGGCWDSVCLAFGFWNGCPACGLVSLLLLERSSVRKPDAVEIGTLGP